MVNVFTAEHLGRIRDVVDNGNKKGIFRSRANDGDTTWLDGSKFPHDTPVIGTFRRDTGLGGFFGRGHVDLKAKTGETATIPLKGLWRVRKAK